MSDDWGKWSMYVLEALKSIKDDLGTNDVQHRQILDKLGDVERELAVTKREMAIRSSLLGVVAGAVSGGMILALRFMS